MNYWRRAIIPNGFEWTSEETDTSVLLQVKDHRWSARMSVLLTSGEREDTSFFAEDSYYASLEKCLMYVWRAMIIADKSTFDVDEALADLQRFVL